MKTIFKQETEIGKCDWENTGATELCYAEPDLVTVFAHTEASLNSNRGMLRVEQRCHMPHGRDLPDQPWMRPEVTFEPVLESVEEMQALVEIMHEKYVDRIRGQLPETHLA